MYSPKAEVPALQFGEDGVLVVHAGQYATLRGGHARGSVAPAVDFDAAAEGAEAVAPPAGEADASCARVRAEVGVNWKPLGANVIVELEPDPEERTPGGIYIPDTAKEKPRHGKVLATGPDVEKVKKGSEVLTPKYAGSEFKEGAKTFTVYAEKDLLASR